MARGVNKVILIGNLGKDPETKSFANGGSVTSVSLATSETWKGKDGQQMEHTEWHNLVFHEKLGEIVQKYLSKGSKVYIEGSIRTRKYQDKEGKDQRFMEIRVSEMQMLDPKQRDDDQPSRSSSSTRASVNQHTQQGHEGGGFEPDSDIPFAPRHWKEG